MSRILLGGGIWVELTGNAKGMYPLDVKGCILAPVINKVWSLDWWENAWGMTCIIFGSANIEMHWVVWPLSPNRWVSGIFGGAFSKLIMMIWPMSNVFNLRFSQNALIHTVFLFCVVEISRSGRNSICTGPPSSRPQQDDSAQGSWDVRNQWDFIACVMGGLSLIIMAQYGKRGWCGCAVNGCLLILSDMLGIRSTGAQPIVRVSLPSTFRGHF